MTESSPTVLVVDDEAAIREVLRKSMVEAGYKVIAAGSGEEALEAIAQNHPDLVLLDIKMPGLSGVQVLEKVRVLYPDTAIIMETAVGDLTTAVDAMKAGAFDFVTKPFNLDDILVRAERALERKRLLLMEKRYQDDLRRTIEEQRAQIRNHFVQLIESLAREHSLLLERESSGKARGGKKPLQELPEELRTPKASAQEFAKALLNIVRTGGFAGD